MDLFEMLGSDVVAEFGPRHATLPRHYFYASDGADQMARALRGEVSGRSALLFADLRTQAAASVGCADAMRHAGWSVRELLIPDNPAGGSPVCDDITFAALRGQIPPADLFVAVGSGVVNDLVKWLAMDAGVPYAVFATAASMNGYSAANIAPSIRGVKSLLEGRAPRAIASSPGVLARAPTRSTTAGLGDVLAKPVSTSDWRMNHLLFQEPYSATIAGIIDAIEPRYLAIPESLRVGAPQAIQSLFEALIFSGCAMTLQGSSLPASGGEHLISHTLDMFSHVDGQPHDLHGRQVGVATIFVAALYQQAVAETRPVFVPDRVPLVRTVWGGLADAVAEQHQKKMLRTRQACERLRQPGCWDALRNELQPILRQPAVIKECLAKAGGAHRLADLGCSRERFLLAVQHGAAIRARFTSLDLFFAMGLLPSRAEEMVDEWLM
jgi:glycerol-1-phosphate dehydrogenase [NAD(P)+]